MDKNSTEESFWENVIKTDKCWVYQGKPNHAGYKLVQFRRERIFAHRLSWRFTFGEIPEGKLICHHCDNPPCVRPNHLFLGDSQSNIDDMIKKGRMVINRGNKNHRSTITEDQVREVRSLLTLGKFTHRQIAEQLKISYWIIIKIANGSRWGWVK